VWDAATGKELLPLIGHGAFIRSVAFSPDGQRIVTGCWDQTAKVWEAASGKELLTLRGHDANINGVAFSPDGRRIATASDDHTARVWAAASPQQVAGWHEEEQAAAEALARGQREEAAAAERERAARADDPGAIKQWLVLAPIGFEGRDQAAAAAALVEGQIPDEARLTPRAGERVKVGQGERVWSAVELPDYMLDFNQWSGRLAEWSTAYAVCYIQSEAPQTGLLVKVGSDDYARLYLNGKEIYQSREMRGWTPDEDVVANVELKAGINVLVFKVVNGASDWQGSVRFTDAAGRPVKGLRVTLAPP